ncbi:Mu-like prophage FluMu DNA transposition protein B [Clostridia bacterium]|nr:Mu-like prophage FluMu DNA transposition protein B [Clostridia bacterium]
MNLDNHNLDLRDKLANYLVHMKMSQSAFARGIGLKNSSAISQYLSDNGYSSPHMLEPKILEYFKNQEDAKSLGIDLDDEHIYLPTSVSSGVYATIRSCHLKGGLAIECGDAGIGKTKAARKYARDYGSAVYVEANPCISSVTALLKELCEIFSLGMGRKDDMWRSVRRALSGERRVLIIDEAQHLPIKTVEMLRSLSDSNGNLGIMFIGNRLTIDNMGGRHEAAFAQITSRTKHRRTRFTTDISREDVALLYPSVADDRASSFLHQIARSRQGIRGATNLLSRATDNENISFEGLVAMAKHMNLAV